MTFAFHRGSLALDFVGTVGRRTSAAPEERLPDGAALAVWFREAGLLESSRPRAADLADAVALREAIDAVARSMLAGTVPAPAPLRVLNRAAQGLRLGSPRLTSAGHARWVSPAPIRTALARVAADAIDRLARDRDRMTLCQLEGCGALLLSQSRSDPRRWCSMELCGNRAKAAAHRARTRAARA